ncbi:MAG: ATP-binding cassette domain-containing protein, partial [Bdellovibrionales bacterium]|nr:ATP-binding cassette domain-containing protein [Bdellovibrionales bacterium]
MSVIEVEDLSKDFRVFSRREGVAGAFRDLFQRDYRTLKAVDKISFSVEKGELLGYIGPNGAGKSTSIKMLTGILKPTSGKMEVLGYHPFKDRKTYTKHIGVVFGQRTQLWWDIAVIESFNLLSRIYEISPQDYKERLGQLTEILHLGELLHTPVRKLSLGQRLRCDLASSLIHDP